MRERNLNKRRPRNAGNGQQGWLESNVQRNQTNIYLYMIPAMTNLLSLLRSSYKVTSKLLPLSDKIGTTLYQPLSYNIMLATGRISRLAGRIRDTHRFINFILSMQKLHGTTFTVKWMKACHVAICKVLGANKLMSLRQLDENLPLPRLVNGLPSIIPYEERRRIRQGKVPVIRFWLGLFNLYRVIRVPGELKLSTITSPFTGRGKALLGLCRSTKVWNPFLFDVKIAEKAKLIRTKMAPDKFLLSRSASPSNRVSMYGILTDVHLISKDPILWPAILGFLDALNAEEFKFKLFYVLELADKTKELSQLDIVGVKTGKPISSPDLPFKASIVAHGLVGTGLSQFAIKEEAAGKLRLFALIDLITQSVLTPLHDRLFDMLRVIPTDSTFDQEAGIRRAQDKAVKANKAFSFDLSAATDRLPVLLLMFILGSLIGMPLAKYWRTIIVTRAFSFNGKVAEKLKVNPTGYRYAVGQPMGAKTSWAMLAVAHHWLVQRAAYDVYGKPTWFMEYEVLGDDIVIFDELVAQRYQEILSDLGLEININKSIISKDRPVFEFAKRVCWSYAIVSGISLNQVQAGWRVAGRVANAISFANAGLLETSQSLLLAVLSRNAFLNGKAVGEIKTQSVRSQKQFSLGVLSLLGERFQKGIISLREVMHAIIDPKGPIDLNKDAIAIPIKAASTLAYQALVEGKISGYPYSHEWDREPKYLEMEDKVATEMLHTSINKLKELMNNYDFLIEAGSQQLLSGLRYEDPADFSKEIPFSDLPPKILAHLTDVEQFYSMMLGFEMTRLHPQFLYEELFMLMDSMLLYEEAVEIVDKVTHLCQLLELVKPRKDPSTNKIVETAPLLVTVKGILGSHSKRLWLKPIVPTSEGAVHVNAMIK
nr:MAG: RNA-dependent RNA polymerase [Rhizoctonia solani mitovirus 43]